MSLATGTVSVDNTGTATGSGMALAIYNSMVATCGAQVPATGTALVAWKQGQALLAVAIATGVVPYLLANTVIGHGTFTNGAGSVTGTGTFT